jgi:glutamate formiminotransferase
MNNGRKFQRYAISQGVEPDQVEVFVGKELVRLVNFSVGGFYILSETRLSAAGTINISVNFGNRGKMDLTGRIVRVKKEGEMWGIAIDLSKNYNLHTLKEV